MKKQRQTQRAILYTRVSTDDQATYGYSLPAQEELLRRYCSIQGIEVVAHYREDASAKTFARPEWQRLVGFISGNPGAIDLVLFTRWDRFSRNVEFALTEIRWLQDHGVTPQAIEQPLDLSIPESKFMLVLYLTAPQVENERRAESTTRGMRRAQKEGRWVHRPPVGYSPSRDAHQKPRMVISKDAPFVREAFAEMAKGIYSQEQVRKALWEKGFRPSKTRFIEMLRNILYIGKLPIKAWRDEPFEIVDAIHEPLIDWELFAQVQDVLNGRKKQQRGSKHAKRRDELPLRGHLRCLRCGGNLTGGPITGQHGGRYWYYNCQHGCKERFRVEKAHKALAEQLQQLTAPPEIGRLYIEIMEDIHKEKEGDREQQLTEIGRKLNTIEEDMLKVDERYIDNRLEQDSYDRLMRKYKQQRLELEQRKSRIQSTDTNFMRYVRHGVFLATHLAECYEQTTVEIKQTMLGLIFPDKLVYADGKYQTPRLNEAIAVFCGKSQTNEGKEKGLTTFSGNQPRLVPPTGFEPVLPP